MRRTNRLELEPLERRERRVLVVDVRAETDSMGVDSQELQPRGAAARRYGS